MSLFLVTYCLGGGGGEAADRLQGVQGGQEAAAAEQQRQQQQAARGEGGGGVEESLAGAAQHREAALHRGQKAFHPPDRSELQGFSFISKPVLWIRDPVGSKII